VKQDENEFTEFLVSAGLIATAVAALLWLVLHSGCGPVRMQLYHAPAPHADSVWLASDTVTATQPCALYVLTVASQLMGTMVIDSVSHWSTAGGALRIDRWGKPGPLVVNGDYKIVDIQERH
jgi:hypothetical protein